MTAVSSPSTLPYWLETPLRTGLPFKSEAPNLQGEIVVVGSGLAGVSTAYWLMVAGMEDVVIVDHEPEQAASFRNCGHLLPGTVESFSALAKLKGLAVATDIWHYSVEACELVTQTAQQLGIDCELRRNGYLTVALDDNQWQEIHDSVHQLGQIGYRNELWQPDQLAAAGIEVGLGARFEPEASSMNPVKFRNGLLDWCLARGLRYYSGVEVTSVEQVGDAVQLHTACGQKVASDFAVIAANAYAQNMLPQLKSRQLAVPFRGQILVSDPLPDGFPLAAIPHSFNHGYEYALRTAGNRLIIGGWRDKIPGMERGDYSLEPNDVITAGLSSFAQSCYNGGDQLRFERAWVGIMASSHSGLPIVGPLATERIFVNVGFTGHGLPWTHGTGKLLAEIMLGTAEGPILGHLRFPA